MNQPAYHEITACRLCGGELIPSMDIGTQALSGRFPGPGEEEPPMAPLVVVRCSNCGLVQLLHSVDLGEIYTYDYGYRSGINATMRNHLAGIVAWITERCLLGAGDVVVDIGCNDGTLLKSYRIPGLERGGKFISPLPQLEIV